MEKKNEEGAGRFLPLLGLILATSYVIFSFMPVLAPLLDGRLVFTYIDFFAIDGSAILRAEKIFSVSEGYGHICEYTRLFLLGSLGYLARLFPFTDSQLMSALILISTVIGSCGIYLLVRDRWGDPKGAAVLTAILILFYFLNLWSAYLMWYPWIWYAYAVIPMQFALGLRAIENRSLRDGGAYCLVLSFFGSMPHSFLYMAIVHGSLAAFCAFKEKKIPSVASFALIPMVMYALINAPFLLAFFSSSTQSGVEYPIETSVDNFWVTSANGALTNLLGFSGTWFVPPAVGADNIYENPVFMASSICVFLAVLSIFWLSRNMLRGEEKLGALFFIAIIMIVLLIAQGLNNDIWRYVVMKMVDAGHISILGPLREWARLCLVIPVFLVAITAFSLPSSPRPRALLAILGLIVLLNIASSPYERFLESVYRPVALDDTLGTLASALPHDARVLEMFDKGQLPATMEGERNKPVRFPGLDAIGSPFDSEGLTKRLKAGEARRSELEVLDISYLLLVSDDKTLQYDWMDCGKVGYVDVCRTGVEPRRFKAYEALNGSWGGASSVDLLALEGLPALAVAHEKVDPARWHVRYNATAPFLLVFSDNFQASWEAKIFKEGRQVSVARPIWVDENIVAFPIDETGELDIMVVYPLQELFDTAKPVSLIGILLCLGAIASGKVVRR
ncbi:MAG: hypothetical protein V1827_01200 [Candidatus Micrarchaeota archaeon]